MIELTAETYLKRIKHLVPSIQCKRGQMINVSATGLIQAANITESISHGCHDLLENFPETDFVLDLKDAMINIYCLSRFLGISLELILNEEEKENESD